MWKQPPKILSQSTVPTCPASWSEIHAEKLSRDVSVSHGWPSTRTDGLWKGNKAWNVGNQSLIFIIFYTKDSILINAWSKLKSSPIKGILSYATDTNINAPYIFPFFDENSLMGFTRMSVFVGCKPATVTCFMYSKILDYISEYLSSIVLINSSGSRWNSTNTVTNTVQEWRNQCKYSLISKVCDIRFI